MYDMVENEKVSIVKRVYGVRQDEAYRPSIFNMYLKNGGYLTLFVLRLNFNSHDHIYKQCFVDQSSHSYSIVLL